MLDKSRKIIIILALIMVGFLFFIPNKLAFAGASSSPPVGGGGSGQGGIPYETAWERWPGVYWQSGHGYIPGDPTPHGDFIYLKMGNTWVDGRYIPAPYACSEWLRWNVYFAHYNPDPAAVEVPGFPDGRFTEEMNTPSVLGYYVDGSSHWDGQRVHGWYSAAQGRIPIDAVWIDKRVEDMTQTDKTLTYACFDNDESKAAIDYRDYVKKQDAKFLWDHRANQAKYEYTTTIDEWPNCTHEEHAQRVTVKWQRTKCIDGDKVDIRPGIWVVRGNDFFQVDDQEYVVPGGVEYDNKEMEYISEQPKSTKELYQPFNLNTNGYAKASETDSTIDVNKWDGQLLGTVDNTRGITNNAYIETLDLNNDTKFKLTFKNNHFGLPDDYNWDNDPKPKYGIGPVPKTSTYANGWNAGGDTKGPDIGWYRCGTQLNAGVSDVDKAGYQLTSLRDLEKTKEEAKTGKDLNYPLHGGGFITNSWGARTISNGDFTLANFEGGSAYPNWWTITYSKEKYFEYGIYYHGIVSAHNFIEAPSYGTDPGTGKQTTGQPVERKSNGWTLKTNGVSDLGLYVRLCTNPYENPVLYGKFRAKTIAGSVTQ